MLYRVCRPLGLRGPYRLTCSDNADSPLHVCTAIRLAQLPELPRIRRLLPQLLPGALGMDFVATLLDPVRLPVCESAATVCALVLPRRWSGFDHGPDVPSVLGWGQQGKRTRCARTAQTQKLRGARL